MFVALYPPIDRARQWLAVVRDFGVHSCRPTPAPAVHITLVFLGERPVERLPGIERAVREACEGATPLLVKPQRIVSMPSRRPRLLALTTDAPPALLYLQLAMRSALADELPDGQSRAFTPHLTLCRAGRGARLRSMHHVVSEEPFVVDHVRLVRSELASEGATHEEVMRVALAPA